MGIDELFNDMPETIEFLGETYAKDDKILGYGENVAVAYFQQGGAGAVMVFYNQGQIVYTPDGQDIQLISVLGNGVTVETALNGIKQGERFVNKRKVKGMRKQRLVKKPTDDYTRRNDDATIIEAIRNEYDCFDSCVELEYIGTDWEMGSQYYAMIFKNKEGSYTTYSIITVLDWTGDSPTRGIESMGYEYTSDINEAYAIYHEKIERETRGTRKSKVTKDIDWEKDGDCYYCGDAEVLYDGMSGRYEARVYGDAEDAVRMFDNLDDAMYWCEEQMCICGKNARKSVRKAEPIARGLEYENGFYEYYDTIDEVIRALADHILSCIYGMSDEEAVAMARDMFADKPEMVERPGNYDDETVIRGCYLCADDMLGGVVYFEEYQMDVEESARKMRKSILDAGNCQQVLSGLADCETVDIIVDDVKFMVMREGEGDSAVYSIWEIDVLGDAYDIGYVYEDTPYSEIVDKIRDNANWDDLERAKKKSLRKSIEPRWEQDDEDSWTGYGEANGMPYEIYIWKEDDGSYGIDMECDEMAGQDSANTLEEAKVLSVEILEDLVAHADERWEGMEESRRKSTTKSFKTVYDRQRNKHGKMIF